MALVREVTYDDIKGVADLHRAVGWAPPSLEAWRHLWMENPALADTSAVRRGWVLEDRSQIGGFMCNVAQEYRLGDRLIRAATASAMVVAPALRGETMKLVMAFAQQPHVDLLLNTTAAPQTSKIFEFFKFRRIPQPDYDVSLFWVLRPASFLTGALRKKGWSPALSGIAGRLLAPILSAEMALRRRSVCRGAKRNTAKIMNGGDAPSDVDELWWRRVAERHRLLANRTAETLRWHYAAQNRPTPPRLICAYDGSRLIGFAALVRRDSLHLGLKRAYLADVFVERDEPEAIRQLLVTSALQARAEGAVMLEAVGFPEHIRNVFREFHPYTLRNDSWPFLYRARDPEMQHALADPALWHACLFDGDGSL